MSTPRERPESSQARVSRDARVKPAKGQSQYHAGTGIDEAPRSRRFRMVVVGMVILVISVIATIIADAISSRKYSLFDPGLAPTIAISPDEGS